VSFEIDDEIRVRGVQGRFKVVEIRKDGDLTVFGGTGGCDGVKKTTGVAQMRTFAVGRCRKIKARKAKNAES
jgi:hypothetical protein